MNEMGFKENLEKKKKKACIGTSVPLEQAIPSDLTSLWKKKKSDFMVQGLNVAKR